jgi:hypothetical protein
MYEEFCWKFLRTWKEPQVSCRRQGADYCLVFSLGTTTSIGVEPTTARQNFLYYYYYYLLLFHLTRFTFSEARNPMESRFLAVRSIKESLGPRGDCGSGLRIARNLNCFLQALRLSFSGTAGEGSSVSVRE